MPLIGVLLMLYGYGGPTRIPGPTNPMPGYTTSAPKTPPNVNYMRSQIAGQMSIPGNSGPMRMTALPRRF